MPLVMLRRSWQSDEHRRTISLGKESKSFVFRKREPETVTHPELQALTKCGALAALELCTGAGKPLSDEDAAAVLAGKSLDCNEPPPVVVMTDEEAEEIDNAAGGDTSEDEKPDTSEANADESNAEQADGDQTSPLEAAGETAGEATEEATPEEPAEQPAKSGGRRRRKAST